jgi:predicted RNA-binding protein YlqC (UPF0109 family)
VPDPTSETSKQTAHNPDYAKLVRFLVQPFLESPDALRLDCEISPRTSRVLIRLAFEGEDKGRVFGRGGRNIQAIRTVIQAVAQLAGHTAHLEVFGASPNERDGSDEKAPPRSNFRPPQRTRPR